MNPGTDWIEQGRRLLETLRNSTEAPDGGHGSDCRWCPVCQAAAVVRGERPEVTAALADVLATAATALRTFAEGGGATAPSADAEEDAADSETPAVQQIDIA